MKRDFEEIVGIAIRIIAEADTYEEDETHDSTATRIKTIKEFSDTIIGIARSLELELGESEEGLK